jgi:hypothetical protein
MPLSAGVYRCGPGKFAHWGVFGNKSFAVEEKAEFVLTLTYQEHDVYVQNSKLEIQLVFEFGTEIRYTKMATCIDFCSLTIYKRGE